MCINLEINADLFFKVIQPFKKGTQILDKTCAPFH